MKHQKRNLRGIFQSIGLVFGDIGTSPIYALAAFFTLIPSTPGNALGIISLIIWALTIVVSIKYGWLVMSLSKKSEGGTIVLKELLVPLLRSPRQIAIASFLSILGISLLIGDGVITPAVTILGAVEGLIYIPGLEYLKGNIVLVCIAAVIAIALFMFQRQGSDRVSSAFAPVMCLWFGVLAFSGIAAITQYPAILYALNPYYGIAFLYQHAMHGMFILSCLILCITGAEALYADMGHLGRRPISIAWIFVFIALALNYLGQGAFVASCGCGGLEVNVLFAMVRHQTALLYIPFVVLSICAAVIASQSLISGVFSIVYQGISTRILPIFKIDYTSTQLRSQIYIGFANWFLLTCVLIVMFVFQSVARLTEAYGLAVAGTMVITGILAAWVFSIRGEKIKMYASLVLLVIDVAFLCATFTKIPQGGYISLVIASLPLMLIAVYMAGQNRLHRAMRPMNLTTFVDKFNEVTARSCMIKGTALFFARDTMHVYPYMVRTIFSNNIIYEDNIIISIRILDTPFGFVGSFEKEICPGVRTFVIKAGYMEVLKVDDILRHAGISAKAIFYGIDDIVTRNIVWRIFALIKKLTPAYVQLYKLPAEKLHGVVSRVEL